MNSIQINNRISYLPASESPLSADVIRIEGDSRNWFFDVGCSDEAYDFIRQIDGERTFIISHFHPDHMDNLKRLLPEDYKDETRQLYVGDNTYKYTQRGIIVSEPIALTDGITLDIRPLPASHAKGCLALIADGICFAGDAFYPTHKKDGSVYNTGLLQQQIEFLENLDADYVALSHRKKLLVSTKNVLGFLQRLYNTRDKSSAYVLAERI